jgi:predicted amidohydrolase
VEELIHQAVADGADLVVFPEVFGMWGSCG